MEPSAAAGAPEDMQLSEEQRWAFDTLGVLHVPAALPVQAKTAATPESLRASALVAGYAALLCGEGYTVDTAARTLRGGVLGGNESRAPGLRRDRFYRLDDRRTPVVLDAAGRLAASRSRGAQRLVVLWATADSH